MIKRIAVPKELSSNIQVGNMFIGKEGRDLLSYEIEEGEEIYRKRSEGCRIFTIRCEYGRDDAGSVLVVSVINELR